MGEYRNASFCTQLRAMLARNLLLKKREKRKTIAEIVLPLYTLSILIVLKLVIPNPNFPVIDTPRGEAKLFEHFQYLKNHTVAVVPNSTDVQKFLAAVNDLWQNMHQDPGLHPINWHVFDTKEDLLTAYWLNPPSIPLAVIFEEPGPLNGPLVYEVKTNPSISQTPATTELFSSPANCRQAPKHWSSVLPIESGDSCPINQYYYSGFVALQTLLDFTKIRIDTNRNDIHVPHILLEMMPKDAFTADWLLAFRVAIPLYMVMAVSQFITYLLILIVGEKEKKIKEGMKIMGLRDSVFWLSWFIIYAMFVSFLSLVCCILLIVSRVFVNTNYWLLFLLILLYSFSIIMFGFMVTPFFDKSRTAGVVGNFAVTIVSLLYYIQVFVDKTQTGLFWLISLISSSGFALAMDKALVMDMSGEGITFDNLWSGPGISFGGSLVMMVVDIILYALIAYYLDSVLPSEHGTKKSPFFCFSKSYWCPKQQIKKIPVGTSTDEENNSDVEPVPREMKGKEAIRIVDIVKAYKSCRKPEITAVNGINLTIYQGQITAILGHNGAGKTTLFNMLTGLTLPTTGTAYIFGYDIRNSNDMDQIRRMTGVCPQHDILFDNLTPREHLDFYAAVKGVPSLNRRLEVNKVLKDIDLVEKADNFAKHLSGGQKRKLSIGIAIIGDPKIIILDEPTAGVDPYSRRHMWSVLQNIRHGKVILLTTHFMDEADILADRKAVMSKGKLRCCGSSLFLKNKFGIGYHLTLVLGNNNKEELIVKLVTSYVLKAEKARRHGRELSFILPYNAVNSFAPLFSAIENEIGKSKRLESGDRSEFGLGITSYGISMTTLEEVFLHLEKDEETDETMDNLSKKMVRERALSRSLSLQSKSTSYHSLQNEGGNSTDKDEMLNDVKAKGLEMHCEVNPNCCQTLIAMTKLRVLRLIRDLRKLYITIGLPLLIAATGIILFPRMWHSKAKLNSLVLNGSTYGSLNTFAIHNMAGKNLDNFIEPLQALGARDVSFYNGNFAHLLDIAPKMAALNISVFDDPEYNITAIYNDTLQHSLPILINFITNSLYRMQRMEKVNVGEWQPIVVKSQPLQLTSQPPDLNFTAFMLAVFLGMLFVLVPISLAIDVVYDREIKAKNQLRVNGLSLGMYFLSFFIVQIVIMLIICAALLVIIMIENVPSLNQWPALTVLGTLIFFYCIPGILFSTCLNYMFDKTDSAQSIMPNSVTCIGFVPFFIVGMLDMLGIGGKTALCLHIILSIMNTMYTPYAIVYYVQRTYMMCSAGSICDTLSISNYMTTEIIVIFVGMIIQIPIYSAVLVIVDVKKSGGSIYDAYRACFGSKREEVNNYEDVSDVGENEDADVKSERQKVSNILNRGVHKPPVVLVHNLHKEYKKHDRCCRQSEESSKIAIRSLSLAVDAGEVLGLLGHNGAGKTTTMKIIIAEEVATRGRVQVDGENITSSMGNIFKLLGYCPQHDALWKNITVREHLECYASIRGVPKRHISTMVDLYLSGLQIHEHADKKAHQCSGGTKRKLSYAMAMIGNPKVVLLDEPSTGMDPRSKRFLWDTILASFQGRRGAMLTTHSMEEADALCSRVGIMVKGELRCLGSTQHLKNLYGAGYTLEMKLRGGDSTPTSDTHDRQQVVRTFVYGLFPNAVIEESFADRLVFSVPQKSVQSLARVFTQLEKAKTDLDIEEYSFSQTTLEQVFLKFAQYDEINGD